MKIHATTNQIVEIDPLDVLKNINIIHAGDWIVERGEKLIQMTKESAGQHSYDREVGEVSEETYELYKAQKLLLEYFIDKRREERKDRAKRELGIL